MKKKAFKTMGMMLSFIIAGLTVQTPVHAAVEHGWEIVDGNVYWYEGGVKQGTEGRGKEIYDPDSGAWYWLDAVDGGRVAKSKDVYQESLADDIGTIGKWVRYDSEGHMVKGWSVVEAGAYYFDLTYGTMAKGSRNIDGVDYYFNEDTGIMENCSVSLDAHWETIDGRQYWYEGGIRQGYDPIDSSYRGKEIYDPGSDAWYWLDNVQQGAKAVSKDVYQESQADDAGTIGKWVRYDADGHMVKGWSTNENGTYYFDPVYGTMAKGEVIIDGTVYRFDEGSGTCEGEGGTATDPGTGGGDKPSGNPAQNEYDYAGRIIKEYDDGKLVKAYKYGDEWGRSHKHKTEYQYDENERLIKEINYDVYGKVNYWYEYQYDEKGLLIKEIYHYKKSSSGWSEYQYDENGYKVKNTVYYNNGEVNYCYEYQNDENGNPIKMIDDDGNVVYLYEYQYDGNGNLIKEILRYVGEGWVKPSGWCETSYDGNGNVIQEMYYDDDGVEVVGWWEYQRSENGIPIRFTYYYGDGNLGQEYQYDANGNLVKEISCNEDGKYYYWNEYQYDAKGNLIKEIRHDDDGKVSGWYEYQCGANGNRVKEFYYGSDGIMDWERQYDVDGNKIKHISYDSNGKVTGWTEYQYDVDGNEIKHTGYDENGNEFSY